MASSSKQFVLVRWTEDEMVGVMPISAVMKDYTPQVGAVVKMKWRGKQVYEAEILKISGKLEPVTISSSTSSLPDNAAGLHAYVQLC